MSRCPNQGRNCPGCTKQSRAALGIDSERDAMEGRVVRLLVILLAVIAVCAVLAGK